MTTPIEKLRQVIEGMTAEPWVSKEPHASEVLCSRTYHMLCDFQPTMVNGAEITDEQWEQCDRNGKGTVLLRNTAAEMLAVVEASKAYFAGREKYQYEGYAKHDTCIEALSALDEKLAKELGSE